MFIHGFVTFILFIFSSLTLGAASLGFLQKISKLIKQDHWSSLESLVYYFVVGIILNAFFAFGLLFFEREGFVFFWWFIHAFSFLFILYNKKWSQFRAVIIGSKEPLIIFTLYSALCVFLCLLNLNFPDPLIDGPYVIKDHSLHTKIQVLTADLPADNYLPYLFSDLLIRKIPFQKVRPLLPGQEVSNRTVLMGLVGSTFRVLQKSPMEIQEPIGTFTYGGSIYPDVRILNSDPDYFVFLMIGIALNGLVLLGSLLFASDFGNKKVAIAVLFFNIINPFIITQIFFIWPKMLSAFFIIMAFRELLVKNRILLSSFFLALGYHSHPLTLSFFIGFVCYLFYKNYAEARFTKSFCKVGIFFGTFALTILPWWIWSRFILNIPSNLFAQNFFIFAPEHKILNFFWGRISNLFLTILPINLTHYPFSFKGFFLESLFSIPGGVGLIIFLSSLNVIIPFLKRHKKEFFFLILFPTSILFLTFSGSHRLALQGNQFLIVLLSFFAFLGVMKLKSYLFVFRMQFLFWLLTWSLHFKALGIFNFNNFPDNRMLFIFITGIIFYAWIQFRKNLKLAKRLNQ